MKTFWFSQACLYTSVIKSDSSTISYISFDSFIKTIVLWKGSVGKKKLVWNIISLVSFNISQFLKGPI